MWVLWIVAAIGVSWGLVSLLPKPVATRRQRIRKARDLFGLEQTQKRAKLLGFNFNLKHYVLMLMVSTGAGLAVSFFLKNMLFIGVGAVLGFLLPKIFLSAVEYRRRRETLMNLPTNLRMLSSKLLECKSVEASLERSIPLMTGITKPHFEHLYDSLRLGIGLESLLNDMKAKIRFQKFDDLCEKLLTGSKDGFHEKAIDGIKESIEDIQGDIHHLKKLDIENANKIMMMYVTIVAIWSMLIVFSYMEHEAEVFQLTVDTLLGKIIVACMSILTLITLLMKDKFLRLNLNKL
ncbi:type II secretion system F family protein [Paenibacillus polymyxa]|uniref:type II secretion system F family protein n=1 Tax=Paenibacillus polymyxa TaxID=1406 RepID=UPI0032AF2EC1